MLDVEGMCQCACFIFTDKHLKSVYLLGIMYHSFNYIFKMHQTILNRPFTTMVMVVSSDCL